MEADERRSRSQTALMSSVNTSTMKPSRGLFRTESAPLYRNYVPSLYKNPDPEITKKLEAFLQKPPLNSPGNLETTRRTNVDSSSSLDRRGLHSRKSLSYEYEVVERFKHLLPEKQKIQQLMLPPIMEGCRENFNHYYKNPSQKVISPGDLELSEQFLRLKYCRYIRHGPSK